MCGWFCVQGGSAQAAPRRGRHCGAHGAFDHRWRIGAGVCVRACVHVQAGPVGMQAAPAPALCFSCLLHRRGHVRLDELLQHLPLKGYKHQLLASRARPSTHAACPTHAARPMHHSPSRSSRHRGTIHVCVSMLAQHAPPVWPTRAGCGAPGGGL